MYSLVNDPNPSLNLANLASVARGIVGHIPQIAANFKTNQILLLYGDDFSHIHADKTYNAMDLIIKQIEEN